MFLIHLIIFIILAVVTILAKQYLGWSNLCPDFVLIAFCIFCCSIYRRKRSTMFDNFLTGIAAGAVVDVFSLSSGFGMFMLCYGVLALMLTWLIDHLRIKKFVVDGFLIFIASVLLAILYTLFSYVLYARVFIDKWLLVFAVAIINTLVFLLSDVLIQKIIKNKKIIL